MKIKLQTVTTKIEMNDLFSSYFLRRERLEKFNNKVVPKKLRKIPQKLCSKVYFNTATNLKLSVSLETEAVAQRRSLKKSVLRNFSNFTGKHLRESLQACGLWILRNF